MGNENREKINNVINPPNNGDFETITKSLQRQIGGLKNELAVAEDAIIEEQKRNESLKKQFNESQVALSQIKEIINKLKISSPGIYNLSAADLKEIQQIFYETLKN